MNSVTILLSIGEKMCILLKKHCAFWGEKHYRNRKPAQKVRAFSE